MTTYKVLYWQEIPTQIKAEDEADDVTVMLDGRFMAQVDILAAKRGLQDADDYLAQWKWSEEEEREGSAREVAERVKAELEAKNEPLTALLTGVDDGWEVCLLKFMVDMIQTSFPGNMGDFRERGML